jgi:hypothetical protein
MDERDRVRSRSEMRTGRVGVLWPLECGTLSTAPGDSSGERSEGSLGSESSEEGDGVYEDWRFL